MRAHGNTEVQRVTFPMGVPCLVLGCDALAMGRGMCTKHYRRVLQHGDPDIVIKQAPEPIAARFSRFYSAKPNGCWEWIGYLDKRGYGQFRLDKDKNRSAHRVSWELAFGPIPEGFCVLHKCDNAACVYPGHLFLGTQLDNIADRDIKGRTAKGSKCALSKLVEVQVHRIKNKLTNNESYRAIAEEFCISTNTVRDIDSKKTWKHVL